MTEKQSIFLVGPMGAGKSTIGKVLSELTSMPLIDSDAEIEKRTGADISWVFDVLAQTKRTGRLPRPLRHFFRTVP